VRFTTNDAKDWIRTNIDLPPLRDMSAAVKAENEPVGYLGTPGEDLLDLLAWKPYLDFAFASERDSVLLRNLRFNVGRYFPEGFVQATERPIEEVLAAAGDEWFSIFDSFDQWPCLVNYDVYANLVHPRWEAFRRDDGFWRGVRNYLRMVQDSVPCIVLLITTNLRGKVGEYDVALRSILKEVEAYGVEVPQPTIQSFEGSAMSKKCQVCIPYWLSRFAATPEGFVVDILESLDYVGTEDVRMVHLILKVTPVDNPASAEETTLLELVNFPHRSLVQTGKDEFELTSVRYPVLGEKPEQKAAGGL